MRKYLALILAVALLLTGTMLVSAQEGETLPATVNQYLFVRVLPDVKAYNYGRLAPETAVTLIARTPDSDWVKLTTDDDTVGWGRPNALVVDGDLSVLPVQEIGLEQGAVTHFLNVRDMPDIDAGRSMRLTQGEVVDLVAFDGEWLYIQAADGSAGYVNPRGLAIMRAPGLDQPELPELPSFNATVMDAATLYALPADDAAVVSELAANAPLNVLGRNAANSWLEVEDAAGNSGWVMLDVTNYDAETSGELLATNASLVSDGAMINVRSGPGTDFSVPQVLDPGTRVFVRGVDATGEWFEIIPPNRAPGWVFSGLVDLDGSLLDVPVLEASAMDAEVEAQMDAETETTTDAAAE